MDEEQVGTTQRAEDGGTKSHDHGSRRSSRKLALVAGINLVGFFAELAGGLLFGSVALLSDAVHMFFDALAYAMAFAAAHVADRYEGSSEFSYGLHRLEPLSAFLNGVLLIPMVGFILWESYQRVLQPIDIGTGPTLVIAIGGLVLNLVSVYILHGRELSLNEKGAMYHLLGDAGGSVAVIVSVIVIHVTGIRLIDPVVAALIAVLILYSAGTVLGGSSAIFLLKNPLETSTVRETIESVDGVDRIDDLHVWQICSQITVATAHLETSVETMAAAETVTEEVHSLLAAHGVDHATVELCPSYAERRTYLNAHDH